MKNREEGAPWLWLGDFWPAYFSGWVVVGGQTPKHTQRSRPAHLAHILVETNPVLDRDRRRDNWQSGKADSSGFVLQLFNLFNEVEKLSGEGGSSSGWRFQQQRWYCRLLGSNRDPGLSCSALPTISWVYWLQGRNSSNTDRTFLFSTPAVSWLVTGRIDAVAALQSVHFTKWYKLLFTFSSCRWLYVEDCSLLLITWIKTIQTTKQLHTSRTIWAISSLVMINKHSKIKSAHCSSADLFQWSAFHLQTQLFFFHQVCLLNFQT